MKTNILRKLIKEELSKALNEINPKYKEGDTFLYKGTKHVVVSDDGYSIVATTPNGDKKKLNYNMIKETVVLAKVDQSGRAYIRGIENLVKKYPELNLQDMVDSALTDHNVTSLGDLSVDDVMKLNLQIQKTISDLRPGVKVDKDLEDKVKGAFLGGQRQAGKTSGLD